MAYEKPWMSFDDQLNHLKSRGLVVTDEQKALEHLERIGYYRISGYWFPFRQRTAECCPLFADGYRKFKKGMTDKLVLNEFKAGATFQQAVDLYVFDKKLRLLVMDGLERIEVALRVDMSHLLGKKHAFAYLKPECLQDDFAELLDKKTGLSRHHQWLQHHARLIARSKEEFIRHNTSKYGLPLAVWIACEVWDFGVLSTLFSGMLPVDQNQIAQKYGIGKGQVFASWLRCLNYLRNVCAHHSRLWNRNIVDQPKKPDLGEAPLFEAAWNSPHELARPFVQICIIQHMLTAIHPDSTWWSRVKEQLLSFPDLSHLGLNLGGMGVIEEWQDWEWA